MFRAGVLKLVVLKTRILTAAVAAATLVFVTVGSAVVLLGAAPASATQNPPGTCVGVGQSYPPSVGVCVDLSSLQLPTPAPGSGPCLFPGDPPVCVPISTSFCVGLPGIGVYPPGVEVYIWECP